MTPAGVLRVAAAQAASVSGDVEANVATAVALVAEAAGNGARLVVLPELFLTGYDPAAWLPGHGVTTDDPRLAPLGKAGAEHGVVVIAGAALRRGDGAVLGLVVADETGELRAPYAKQHLFDSEQAFFTAGDRSATVAVDGWDVGLGICYDGCFPEHATAAAEAGATLYVCPSAYFAGSDHRRDLYYAARALDNGIYVVFSGLTGRCGELEFGGGSAVYDPEGRALARVGAEAPAVAYADLDPAEVRRVQDVLNPIARDRARAAAHPPNERTRVVLGR
ncbi:MAG: carbon-nitrogen hydrolase family protein [Nocardioidaceae bacterium]